MHAYALIVSARTQSILAPTFTIDVSRPKEKIRKKHGRRIVRCHRLFFIDRFRPNDVITASSLSCDGSRKSASLAIETAAPLVVVGRDHVDRNITKATAAQARMRRPEHKRDFIRATSHGLQNSSACKRAVLRLNKIKVPRALLLARSRVRLILLSKMAKSRAAGRAASINLGIC